MEISEGYKYMRKQYHLKKTENGFNAWDVDLLIEKTRNFEIIQVSVNDVIQNNENHWYQSTENPSVSAILKHMKLVNKSKLDFPIIIDSNGIVMDGMHRVGKAYLQNLHYINAVKFSVIPVPDFIDINPDDLSYKR